MARLYVQHPETGEWAIFSEFAQMFLTDFHPVDDIIEMILDTDGIAELEAGKVKREELNMFLNSGISNSSDDLRTLEYYDAVEMDRHTLSQLITRRERGEELSS